MIKESLVTFRSESKDIRQMELYTDRSGRKKTGYQKWLTLFQVSQDKLSGHQSKRVAEIVSQGIVKWYLSCNSEQKALRI